MIMLFLAAPLTFAQSPVRLTIRADQPGMRINPAMWGVFFEDINFGADGGLYAELVKNRSFEFPEPLMGWRQISSSPDSGTLEVRTENPCIPANPHYLRLIPNRQAPFGVAERTNHSEVGESRFGDIRRAPADRRGKSALAQSGSPRAGGGATGREYLGCSR